MWYIVSYNHDIFDDRNGWGTTITVWGIDGNIKKSLFFDGIVAVDERKIDQILLLT
jgi:hypothetical protein